MVERHHSSRPVICCLCHMERIHSDHSRLDERSLDMHQLIAEKVRAEPALLEKARENVRRWQRTEGSPMLALAE
jgi:hypothetical protein